MDINKLKSKIDLKSLPSVSPDSSPSDISSSSEQMLRILTSISVTKMNKNSIIYHKIQILERPSISRIINLGPLRAI